jgi:arabinose-5-phosphate isomerase
MNQADRSTALRRGHAVLQAESQAILAADERLGSAFVDAVELILATTGRVCVTGVGKAGLVGNKIQAMLASAGTPAYSLHPVEALHGDLGMVEQGDVVIGLSKSGGSELVRLLPLLRRNGCKLILLTASPRSESARHADVVLEIGNVPEACPLGLAPSSSTAAMLALGDALALTVMELRNVDRLEYAQRHPGGALGRSLLRAREIMRDGLDCPTVSETARLTECYEAIMKAPRRAGAAMIIDGKSRLVGILTQGDFFNLFKNSNHALTQSVAELMTRNPLWIAADALAADALELMREHGIDELPVIDEEGRLQGLIDVQDLVARGFSVFDPR